MISNKYPRGSEWRKWELHIHTPASFHWSGQRFNSDPKSPDNFPLVDEMINALNAAEPAVFVHNKLIKNTWKIYRLGMIRRNSLKAQKIYPILC